MFLSWIQLRIKEGTSSWDIDTTNGYLTLMTNYTMKCWCFMTCIKKEGRNTSYADHLISSELETRNSAFTIMLFSKLDVQMANAQPTLFKHRIQQYYCRLYNIKLFKVKATKFDWIYMLITFLWTAIFSFVCKILNITING